MNLIIYKQSKNLTFFQSVQDSSPLEGWNTCFYISTCLVSSCVFLVEHLSPLIVQQVTDNKRLLQMQLNDCSPTSCQLTQVVAGWLIGEGESNCSQRVQSPQGTKSRVFCAGFVLVLRSECILGWCAIALAVRGWGKSRQICLLKVQRFLCLHCFLFFFLPCEFCMDTV